jgi:hypothetical protein
MRGVTYDTGALIAAEARDIRLWSLHDETLARNVRPVVPTPVLAQAWRGGPQHNLGRLLKGCVIEAFAENAARDVGRLLAASRTVDVVDAAVVVSALLRGDVVVTTDPRDLRILADSLKLELGLHVVQVGKACPGWSSRETTRASCRDPSRLAMPYKLQYWRAAKSRVPAPCDRSHLPGYVAPGEHPGQFTLVRHRLLGRAVIVPG